MKDRLYNLMREADIESGCVHGDCDLKFIADHLIDSGLVVVLPCKVGDTVWRIQYTYDEPYVAGTEYLDIFDIEFEIQFLDWIGEYVFLTKEEAEARLKELQGES